MGKFKVIIGNLLKTIIINITKLYKIENNLIVLVFGGYSGSNLNPIIQEIDNGKLGEYRVKVIREEVYFNSSNIKKIKLMWNKFKSINKAKLVITTHGPMKSKKKTINLELWHGFPLKAMNLMDGNTPKKESLNKINYLISLSSTYSTILNSCFGIDGGKYRITGYPRNDYLFKSQGRKILSHLINKDLSNKRIIFFAPTFRKSKANRDDDGNKKNTNFFGFEKFDMGEFNSFLESNNIIFILKLHPNEEGLFENMFRVNYNNILLLLGSKLLEFKTDLYETINAADLLITDYSSIYFDYLLLNRPIIFTPVDVESYKNTRGLLLEPYEFWIPGDICLNYNELTEKILENLKADKNKESREDIRKIVHRHKDSNSTNRVIKLIDDFMQK